MQMSNMRYAQQCTCAGAASWTVHKLCSAQYAHLFILLALLQHCIVCMEPMVQCFVHSQHTHSQSNRGFFVAASCIGLMSTSLYVCQEKGKGKRESSSAEVLCVSTVLQGPKLPATLRRLTFMHATASFYSQTAAKVSMLLSCLWNWCGMMQAGCSLALTCKLSCQLCACQLQSICLCADWTC